MNEAVVARDIDVTARWLCRHVRLFRLGGLAAPRPGNGRPGSAGMGGGVPGGREG